MGTDDEEELPGWALKLGLGAQWAWMSGRARSMAVRMHIYSAARKIGDFGRPAR